jgi:hypothetical protein
MDVHDQLTHLEATVHGAKAMPMSSSCLVNRAEMLEVIGRLRAAIPATLDHADAVLSERDAILAAGRERADAIVQGGRDEREQLIAHSDVLVAATVRADALTAQARAEAARLLAEADAYIDRKLAEFEVILGQLGSQVNNGRLRLTYRREADLSHFQVRSQKAPKQASAQAPNQAPNQAPQDTHENSSRPLSPASAHPDGAPPDVPAESGASPDAGTVDQQSPATGDVPLGTR